MGFDSRLRLSLKLLVKVIKHVHAYFSLFLFSCIIKVKLMEYMEYQLVKKLMEY